MHSRPTALPTSSAQAFPGDEMPQADERGIGRFLVPLVIVALMGLGVAALWFTLGQESGAPRRQPVKIAVLPDTPPPPPPKEEKKPEPEKVEAKPQPTPD
jgi:type IV secretory pathway VirB10-like protein